MTGNALRIKLKKFGIELNQLAEKMEISPQNLQSKLNATDLKLSTIQEIAGVINRSLYELINDDNGSILEELPVAAKLMDPEKEIPLLNTDAMAGFGHGEVSIMGYELEGYKVPLFRDADFLIPVKGNSMWPKYNSGDIVACKKLEVDTFFQWNKVYVLDTEQGALIKRIKKATQPDHLLIVSENKEYEAFELHTSKIRSVAMVLGRISLE